MRFMTMLKSKEGCGDPPRELMDAIARLGREAAAAGVFVATGGLLPTAAGATVRLSASRITVTDGPFAETKEIVGGYAIYEATTKEEALAWVRRFLDLHKQHWPGWEGEVELRQMMELEAALNDEERVGQRSAAR